MFKTILCPTDLGERSFGAVEKAVAIAHQFNSRITILNVHDEFMNAEERQMLRVSVNDMKEKFRQTAVESKKKIKAHIRELHAEDVDFEYVLKEGTPAKTIVEYAGEHDIDLIVMSTDGRDNLMDYVTGTISEHVVNHAHCPVLIVPAQK